MNSLSRLSLVNKIWYLIKKDMEIPFLNSQEILCYTNISECVLDWIIIVLFAVVWSIYEVQSYSLFLYFKM